MTKTRRMTTKMVAMVIMIRRMTMGVASRLACGRLSISQLLVVLALTATWLIEGAEFKSGVVPINAASCFSSSSSSEPPSSPSSSAFHEDHSVSDTIPGILEDDALLHRHSPDYPRRVDEQFVDPSRHHLHHLHHHDHSHYSQHRHRLHYEQRRLELLAGPVRPIDFDIRDDNLLTERESPLRNFTPNWNVTENRWSDVWFLSFSPADRSLFFLMSNRLWRVNTEPDDSGGSNVSLVAGPWLPVPEDPFFFQTFVMMDGDLSSADNKSLNRIAIVADRYHRSMRAYNVDNVSSAPPFTLLGYSGVPNEENILSLAWDSNRRMLYASSQSALYRMNLSMSDGGNAVLERWIGPARSFLGLVDSSDDRTSVRFNDPFLSSSAISMDGELLYVADRRNDVIRRVKTASGAVETIAGRGYGGTDAEIVSPVGLVLTSDGCHLFVSELTGGQLHLLTFEYSGGRAVSVRVIGQGSSSVPGTYSLLGMAISPKNEVSGETLYVGRPLYSILKLEINESALTPCGTFQEPTLPPTPPSTLPPTLPPTAPRAPARSPSAGLLIGVAASVLVVLAAIVAAIVESRWRCLRSRFSQPERRGSRRGTVLLTHQKATAWWSSSGWTGWSQEKHEQQDSGGNDEDVVELKRPSLLERFSLSEISEACDGFSAARLVGRGGAAEVYKGQLSNGKVVAVKMMKGDFSRAKLRQFQAELDVLGTLRHSHLCSIIGFCEEGGKTFIVYSPFAEGGTLYDRLQCSPTASCTESSADDGLGQEEDEDRSGHHPVAKPVTQRKEDQIGRSSSCGFGRTLARAPLSWQDRLSVAQQIARALRYLHEEVDPPVIHRDVKTKNVLLEDEPRGEGGVGGGRESEGGGRRTRGIRAYLSDFGLAKVGQSVFGQLPAGETVETYNVAGTLGYIAPEYYTSVRLTTKNDVYAFGVVLLELITGRKPFGRSPPTADSQATEEMEKEEVKVSLAAWATRVLGDSLPALTTDRAKRDTSERAVLTGLKTEINTRDSRFMESIRQIADRGLLGREGNVDWSGVCGMAEIAMACISDSPEQRPRMSVVMERLARLDGDDESRR